MSFHGSFKARHAELCYFGNRGACLELSGPTSHLRLTSHSQLFIPAILSLFILIQMYLSLNHKQHLIHHR